jgi:hypothetical protein
LQTLKLGILPALFHSLVRRLSRLRRGHVQLLRLHNVKRIKTTIPFGRSLQWRTASRESAGKKLNKKSSPLPSNNATKKNFKKRVKEQQDNSNEGSTENTVAPKAKKPRNN